ncbi:diaminopropionate ammonia-lyase [Phreatobacter sp. AB_2022a]|uniref:diaminopropionate ammonia-lyase n=1 Tax=Phreatobacter sp. AB_2022a TaxID=3003134 RepID=UPI002286E77A|nr:diaminopropionate ammonia-lyase [Phreatobacter sp. AB_2022a]MCZ0737887.1 diaminopropionate ammonia-lyase [Phreatobacter sp. AB_2022a]
MTTGNEAAVIAVAASGARLIVNPALDRHRPYGADERAILSLEGAATASAAIRAWDGYRPTPLHRLDTIAAENGIGGLLYKDEGKRFGLKSFKAMGGAYAVERLVAARGSAEGLTVTCATDGNHGRAVAWGARRLGVRAVIYVHETVSPGRVRAIEGFGAEVRRVAGHYDDAVRASAAAAAENGWTIVSDTSWPGYDLIPRDVMQGYAVLAQEAETDGPAPSHIFVQGGVGGLAAGILSFHWEKAGAARPVIVVVEPDTAGCLFASALAGGWTAVGGDLDTIMAGLACGEPSRLAWSLLDPGADAFVTIPDARAAEAMRLLATQGIAAGESGVAGLAGFLSLAGDPAARAALGLDAGSTVLCFGTEGATDPEIYRAIVGREPEAVEGARA